jgi:hypothetical protein
VFCIARSSQGWRSQPLDPVESAAEIARYRADYPIHEVETYYPASAPNVLSEEEATDLAYLRRDLLAHDWNLSDRSEAVLKRLAEYAAAGPSR